MISKVDISPNGDYFAIDLAPHVAARFKRIFPRAQRKGCGLRLRITGEVCRDLEWFAQRFPIQFTPACDLLVKSGAEAERQTEATTAEILSGGREPKKFPLAVPLRDYQAVAADIWLQNGSLLLADALGLGKTATAIAGLSDGLLPAVVVTLTHLPDQWSREFGKFLPDARVGIARTGKPWTPEKLGSVDVLVLNYHKLSSWAPALTKWGARAVVFDECQELRRTESNKYHGAEQLALCQSVTHRIGLSATPIYNYGGEFHAVMGCIAPDLLGDWAEFAREWCAEYYERQKATIRDPRAFGGYLRTTGRFIRRSKSEVRRELPEVSQFVQSVEADEERIESDIGDTAAELAGIILGQSGASGWEIRRASGELDWKLRQATGIAKAHSVADFLHMILEQGDDKVLVYAWHREVYGILQSKLSRYNPVMYTGSESPRAKSASFDRFVDGSSRVMLMSLRAGAGLDGLQGVCSTVVFAELDWSPGVHAQCVGRVHRDGQTEPVFVYYLVSDEGSDPVVSSVLGIKRGQSGFVLDPDSSTLEVPGADADRIKKLAESYLGGKNGKRTTTTA